jgi:hypothetical protein
MALKVFLFLILFLIFTIEITFAQQIPPKGDVCHVYVVDVAKAEKALKKNDEKLIAEAEVDFPAFTTEIGEEVETAKTYPFPKSKSFILAKVFYTDESIYSKYTGKESEFEGTDQSIMLTILVSSKEKPVELSDGVNSIMESTYDENTIKVRTKMFVKILKRTYLIGLECDCSLKRESKPKN